MIEATKQRLAEMKLSGMLRAYQALQEPRSKAKGMTADEVIAHLVECEWSERTSRKISGRLRQARLRLPASFENIAFGAPRKIDRGLLMRLGECTWIRNAENVIITGPTGAGKSYLACALGQRACLHDMKVMYFQTSKLFSALSQAQADHSQGRLLGRIKRQHLIILDDFGLEPIAGEQKLKLFEILEDRYGIGSTVVVSQVPTDKWHAVIKDATIADAICDRLLHNAHSLKVDGPSMRSRTKSL